MASTTFIDGTVVEAAWLNDVNTRVYRDKLYVADYVNPATATPANTTLGIQTAIAAAIAADKDLHFESGATYTTDGTIAFLGSTYKGMGFYGNGCMIYMATGSGPVATLSSGANTSRTENNVFRDFVLKGNASATYGLDCLGLGRSLVENIRVIDVATAGFRTRWSVLSNFKNLIVSNNVDTFTVNPQYGIHITQSDVGFYTAACVFENLIMEAPITDTGVNLDVGGFNLFLGGSCEGIPRGAVVRNGSNTNMFECMDFEGNSVYDVEIFGQRNSFNGCNFTSAGSSGTVFVQSSAVGTRFTSGFLRLVNLDASSTSTRFYGVPFSDNVSLGIQGTGPYQSYGCYKVDTNGFQTSLVTDVTGAVGSFLATLTGCTTSPSSSIAYTQNGGAVTLTIPAITASSNSTAATLTGMPAAIRPSGTRVGFGLVQDNSGTATWGVYSIASSGVITMNINFSTAFTAAGTKGSQACSITYNI